MTFPGQARLRLSGRGRGRLKLKLKWRTNVEKESAWLHRRGGHAPRYGSCFVYSSGGFMSVIPGDNCTKPKDPIQTNNWPHIVNEIFTS